MQIVIPPEQSLAKIAAYLSLSRAEATGLRDALELMLATGSSSWHAYICWGDYQTDVTTDAGDQQSGRSDPTARRNHAQLNPPT